jgi:two-component system, OmpR family, response regulator TctD
MANFQMPSKVSRDSCRKVFMRDPVAHPVDRNAAFQFSEHQLKPVFDLHVDTHPPSVLIADDDPNVAPLVRAALRPYQVHTEVVLGGTDALSRLRERSYSLLVLDLEMAGVHGFQVLRALRETPRYERVPVLILTANGTNEALARSFGSGADEFIRKPFDLREFGLRAFRLIRPFQT